MKAAISAFAILLVFAINSECLTWLAAVIGAAIGMYKLVVKVGEEESERYK